MPLCCPALLPACGNHSGEAERCSGVGLKPFGFIPEPVFTFIPESCSRSSRNTVRNHPGIAFILPRIPHKVPSEGIEPFCVNTLVLSYHRSASGNRRRTIASTSGMARANVLCQRPVRSPIGLDRITQSRR